MVGHIAAAITIAYEEGRAPKIRIAMQVRLHLIYLSGNLSHILDKRLEVPALLNTAAVLKLVSCSVFHTFPMLLVIISIALQPLLAASSFCVVPQAASYLAWKHVLSV